MRYSFHEPLANLSYIYILYFTARIFDLTGVINEIWKYEIFDSCPFIKRADNSEMRVQKYLVDQRPPVSMQMLLKKLTVYWPVKIYLTQEHFYTLGYALSNSALLICNLIHLDW